MEETGEGGEGIGVIIDEGIKETGIPGREDVVVGNGSRDEGGMAGREVDLVAGGTDAKRAVALETHRDNETVVFAKVAVEGSGDLHHTDIEIRGVDDLDGTVGRGDIFRAVVGLNMKVEGLGCQVCMQRTGLAIHARTVVVENAVGDIARLLDLGQEDAATDGMDTACGEIEDIARLDLVVGKDLSDSAISDATVVFFQGYLQFETGIEMRPFIGPDDIPHLRLTHLTMQPPRHVVVGMDLDAQVALRINELDQERQLAVVSSIDSLAKDGLGEFADDRNEVTPFPLTIGDDAGAPKDSTDFPAFTNGISGGRQAFVGAKLATAPDNRVEIGLEK